MILSNNKTIKIKGGLGNQLFQYAFGKYLEKNFKYNVKFNTSYYNNQSGTRKFILNDLLQNFNYETVSSKENLFEKLLNFRTEKLYKYIIEKKFSLLPNTMIGYWQDLYFANSIETKDFKKGFFNFNNSKIEKNYYVLHFRGGDFYNSKAHIVLDVNYYKNCLNFFQDKPIYCITDDHKNLDILLNNLNCKNTFKLELNELDAFKLIYNSQGGIASNSTFCWWAVYLSNKRNWIFPKSWLKNKNLLDENLLIDNTLAL